MDPAVRHQVREERLARLSRRQRGLLTAAQAARAGFSTSAVHRRISSGAWERVYAGVYRLAVVPVTWEQSLLAACLWSRGVCSHRAAASLWGLMDARLVEIILPSRTPTRPPVTILHYGALSEAERARVGGIPVTDPARTLLDLGAVVPPAVVRVARDEALRRRLVTERRLRVRLEELGGRGRRGWGVLRTLLEEPRAESVLERRLLRILRIARLPPPVTQYEVRHGSRLVARVDLAYPGSMVAIEAEGYRFHGGPEAYARDLARRNRLTALGWRVLHVTWSDVTRRPAEVAEEVGRAILFASPRGSSRSAGSIAKRTG